MLRRLSIRNIVLIDRLDIDLAPGLCVITGETGAGKSIFLDALGLALGFRADSDLLGIHDGHDGTGVVTAVFAPPAGHRVFDLLAEQGFWPDGGGGTGLAALPFRGRPQSRLYRRPAGEHRLVAPGGRQPG